MLVVFQSSVKLESVEEETCRNNCLLHSYQLDVVSLE